MYIVFFPLNFDFLRSKLAKVCDSFHSETVDLPKGGPDRIRDQLNKTKTSLDNAFNSLNFTVEHFRKILEDIHYNETCEGFSIIKIYKMYLAKTKLIYVNLNKM